MKLQITEKIDVGFAEQQEIVEYGFGYILTTQKKRDKNASVLTMELMKVLMRL